MLYHLYEFGQAAMSPGRAAADSARFLLRNPFNPLSYTQFGRNAAAAAELIERTTRRYKKPGFRLPQTNVRDEAVSITEEIVWQKPFCRLLHFKKNFTPGSGFNQPRLLIVAPLSGHYATLLRGTVEAMLPFADVYITDWKDARTVSMRDGAFDLDDYIDYVIEAIELFQGDVHVMGVCQPAVPVLAAVALMEARGNPALPRSAILKGGPVDTRIAPTAVNDLAVERGINWYRKTVITAVPWPNEGYGRLVYPGFLQLSGFMAMNLDRHIDAHKALFDNLVKGDGDSVGKHKEFYDEYLAVMDLTAEYYLQTVDRVFVKHLMPKGEFFYRESERIDLAAIRTVALMTVEGEKDDITGVGQCEAALHLASNLAPSKKRHYTQAGVGHYGIFNGSRFRSEIVPRVVDFMAEHNARAGTLRWLVNRITGERIQQSSAPKPLPIPTEALAAKDRQGALSALPSRISANPAKPVLKTTRGTSLAKLSASRGKAPSPGRGSSLRFKTARKPR